MQRRRFLAVGLAGAAALGAAGLWSWTSRPAGRADADVETARILAAIVPVMLDGAIPAAGLERAAAIRETVDHVGRAIAGLPPSARAELAQLFALLALPIGRRVFAGVEAPWADAQPDAIAAFLASWQSSGWALKRSAYDALHQLIIAAWYGNRRSWAAIGYPGPPQLA